MVKAFEFNVHHLSPVRLRKASKHGWAKKVKMSLLTITMNLFKYAYSIQTVPRRPNQNQNLRIYKSKIFTAIFIVNILDSISINDLCVCVCIKLCSNQNYDTYL